MLERSIERRLVNGVKKAGGLALKLLCPWFTGWPDRTVIMPGARLWFVELKRPGGKTSARQGIVITWLRKMGFDVRVLDSPELVDDFLKELADGNTE